MKINLFINKDAYNTTFSSRKDVLEKSDKFSNELVRNAHKKTLRREDIQKLVSGYIPGLIIKKKTAQNAEERDIAGVYVPDFIYLPALQKYDIGKQIMYIRQLDKRNMSKGEYVKTVAHEMAHAFQANDEDVSEVALMNKSLKYIDADANNEIMNIISNIWSYFEEVLLYPLMDGIKSTTFENKGIFPYSISINAQKMKERIDDIFDDVQEKFPDLDIVFIKKFIKLLLIHEADAYSVEQRAYRKFRREKPQKEDEIIPKLYERISKYIK